MTERRVGGFAALAIIGEIGLYFWYEDGDFDP
jgi:hypothetical protein